MKEYEAKDSVTYYFIIQKTLDETMVRAWTDNKDYAKFYMEVHKCKDLSMRVMHGEARQFVDLVNQNRNDEIKIANIKIRNPNPGKKKETTKVVQIPTTDTELALIREETSDLMGLHIDYSLLKEVLPHLKGYYRKGLEMLMLPEAIAFAVYNKRVPMWSDCDYDELKILFESLPDIFGM